MSASHSDTRKKTSTSSSNSTATQSIADSYNNTLSFVTNTTAGAQGGTTGFDPKMLILGGLGLAAVVVLAFAFNR